MTITSAIMNKRNNRKMKMVSNTNTKVTMIPSPSSSSSSSMDPTIWSKLPEDLLLQVLSHLPLHTLITLRPTSKAFSSLLSSPPFLSLHHHHHRITTTNHHLLLSHPQFSQTHLPAFSPSTSTWHNLTLPPHPSALRLLSSSAGLLCFTSFNPKSPCLLITNPLTCSSTILRPPTTSILSATIILKSPPTHPHGYHLLVTTLSPKWVFLYHSKTRSWTRIQGTTTVLLDQGGAFLGGTVFFATAEPFQVVGLDLKTQRWCLVEAPLRSLAFARVVSTGERLYLVGGVGDHGIARGVRVWELIGAGSLWVEVGSLPEPMWRKVASVCFHKYEHLYCLWQEGAVCLGCVTWPEVLQWTVKRDTWHWLPVCPKLTTKWSCGFRWFSFAPDVYALV